ncbi:MAG: Gfo/Idh/MocA family protein [Planctomyces sp.]
MSILKAEPMKVAIVGCGAIVEYGHLPGAALAEEVDITLLVDRDISRARKLADQFGIAHASNDVGDVINYADAAVIATPPRSHAHLAIELLSQGIHILVEKPMAVSTAECDAMIHASRTSGRCLAIGMTRRFYRSEIYIRDLLRSGILGEPRSFRLENGYDYAWPSATNFILSKDLAGGGVLMGLGSHVLDSMIWVLGPPASMKYFSDAAGGIESECRIEITMSNGATGIVELSRSRNLSNMFRIECERGTVSSPYNGNCVRVSVKGSTLELEGAVHPISGHKTPLTQPEIMADELRNFVIAATTGTEPAASAEFVRQSIQIVEDCYASAIEYPTPWSSAVLIPQGEV